MKMRNNIFQILLSFIDHTRVWQPVNQEHSHREARLSGRMPQIAPRRFAVGKRNVAPRAHSALNIFIKSL